MFLDIQDVMKTHGRFSHVGDICLLSCFYYNIIFAISKTKPIEIFAL